MDYFEAYDRYWKAVINVQPDVATEMKRFIIGIFRKAVPANSKSRVYIELLDNAWRKDAILRCELADKLSRIAGKDFVVAYGAGTRPAFPRWVIAGIGQSLGPLHDLAWEAEAQRRGAARRSRMIGGGSPDPEVGFLKVVKDAVLSRLQNALAFSVKYTYQYSRGLAGPPHRLGRKAQEALGSAWIAVSSGFVADSDRPYRGEFTLEKLETLLSGEYFKKLPPEFAGITLKQARKGYLESRLIGGSAKYPYLLMLEYHLLVKSGRSLVQAGDLRPQDLRLITRLAPPRIDSFR